jgi:hypothetical protein
VCTHAPLCACICLSLWPPQHQSRYEASLLAQVICTYQEDPAWTFSTRPVATLWLRYVLHDMSCVTLRGANTLGRLSVWVPVHVSVYKQTTPRPTQAIVSAIRENNIPPIPASRVRGMATRAEVRASPVPAHTRCVLQSLLACTNSKSTASAQLRQPVVCLGHCLKRLCCCCCIIAQVYSCST